MAEPAGGGTSPSEVIPAGHAALSEDEERGTPPQTGHAGLAIAALGVVFGDMGQVRSTPFGSASTRSMVCRFPRKTFSAFCR